MSAVMSTVDTALVERLVIGLTERSSPPGEERAVCEWAAGVLSAEGVPARLQQVSGDLCNVVAELAGSTPGQHLLLYAPIDTHLEEWDSGPHLVDGCVVGLGANNPKGHAAAVMAATIALARAGVTIGGRISLGLGGGGMPANPSPRQSAAGLVRVGHGVGCSHMLESGSLPDCAVIAKPGDAVSWEEAGLAWFRVTVGGRLDYAGLRGVEPPRNPIVGAARLVTVIDTWIDQYAAMNECGLVRPQGAVGAIHGGWAHKPTFIPDKCEFLVDLRLSPGMSTSDADEQLHDAIRETVAELKQLGLSVQVERVVSIPSMSTDLNSDVILATIRAWESVRGRPHRTMEGQSGATDANILRAAGVPTARVGMPRSEPRAGISDTFGRAMNVCDIASAHQLVEILVRTSLLICGAREREEGRE